jgi:hypothetical protein
MKPVRVVLFFGSLPESGALRFLSALRCHPEIEVVAALAESPGFGLRHRVRELWHRRRWMIVPLLAAEALREVGRWLVHPLTHSRDRRLLISLRAGLERVDCLHAPTVLQRLRRLRPDVGLIYGGPLLREELFTIPRHGTLGIHHGKVPQYRGRKTTFWAMYNGESTAGVTIQRLNAGIDTGEIVAEGEVHTTGRSYRQVWTALEKLGIELFVRAAVEAGRGRASFRPQVGPRGRPYREPKPADFLRYWLHRRRRRAGFTKPAASA